MKKCGAQGTLDLKAHNNNDHGCIVGQQVFDFPRLRCVRFFLSAFSAHEDCKAGTCF